jgi:hypothetical protein
MGDKEAGWARAAREARAAVEAALQQLSGLPG